MKIVNHLWKRLNLGTKIAIASSMLVLVAISALSTFTVQRERTTYQQELESQATMILAAIPPTMRDELYWLQMDEITDVAQIVAQDEDITGFIVFDQNGAILVDSNQPSHYFSLEPTLLGLELLQYQGNDYYLQWEEDELLAGRTITMGNQIIGAVLIGFSTTSLDEKINAITIQSAIIAFIALMMGIGLSVLLAKQITVPLEALENVAGKMASGNLSGRANLNTQDEVGRLAHSFNTMANAIEQRETQLRNLASGLEQTVAERTEELRKKNEVLEYLAITDPLTDSYNRRYFYDLAEAEFKKAHQEQTPLSVIIMDADYFKDANDTYGHLIGDQLLFTLAEVCKNNLRASDIFARFGGEEFVVLMPETDIAGAHRIGERLRQLTERITIPSENTKAHMTISLGIACWQGEMQMTFDMLLARADRALYQAKANGRNQVVTWQDT